MVELRRENASISARIPYSSCILLSSVTRKMGMSAKIHFNFDKNLCIVVLVNRDDEATMSIFEKLYDYASELQ